ncbi:Sucrase/ferredoxin-like-domain-containing protein [Lenzites betulinus]|nr:Sucrase/ferredoxin-like-domain-containing protein [Lenzites betulinus]
MLTLAPTFACRRAPSRLIHACHYTAVRPFSTSPPQTLSDASSSPSSPSSPSPSADGLAGTAPYHTAYILLHTHARPSTYPARSRSPLWRALTLRARQWGAVVNLAWAPAHAGENEGEEAYTASVFARAPRWGRGRLEIPEVSLKNLEDVDAHLRRLVLGDADAGGSVTTPTSTPATEVRDLDRRLHLYVCTHGARDCRCGEGGGAVARTLERELARRGIGSGDVVLGELAHVGGHKYAANVLVYPYGDWLGNVQEADVPRVLDAILDAHHHRAQSELDGAPELDTEPAPLCPPFWRGRMGLDKEEQLALFARAA